MITALCSQLKSHDNKCMEAINTYVNGLSDLQSDKPFHDLGNRHTTFANGLIEK